MKKLIPTLALTAITAFAAHAAHEVTVTVHMDATQTQEIVGNCFVTPIHLTEMSIASETGEEVGNGQISIIAYRNGTASREGQFYWWSPDMFPEEMMETGYWGNDRGEPVDYVWGPGEGFMLCNFSGVAILYTRKDVNTWRKYDTGPDGNPY